MSEKVRERAVSGARTRDLRLGKPLLYQLSYYRKRKEDKQQCLTSLRADNETRTRDPRITNALLYQLSHIGTLLFCECKGTNIFLHNQEKLAFFVTLSPNSLFDKIRQK